MNAGTRPAAGFTLLEMAVSLCIFILLVGVIFTVFTQGIMVWNRQGDRVEIEENLRLVMDRMVREIREASAVSSSSGKVLTLTVPENNTPVEVKYWYDDGRILRQRKGGVNPLSLKTGGVHFLCLPEQDPVTVYIELWGKDSDEQEIHLSAAASRRAE